MNKRKVAIPEENIQQLLDLRAEGKNYKQMSAITGLAHRSINRWFLKRENLDYTEPRNVLQKKITDFQAVIDRVSHLDKPITEKFTIEEFLQENKPICYLSGDALDFENEKTFSLDHVTPRSRNGHLILSNCKATTPRANQMKGTMTHPEYLEEIKKQFYFQNPHMNPESPTFMYRQEPKTFWQKVKQVFE